LLRSSTDVVTVTKSVMVAAYDARKLLRCYRQSHSFFSCCLNLGAGLRQCWPVLSRCRRAGTDRGRWVKALAANTANPEETDIDRLAVLADELAAERVIRLHAGSAAGGAAST